jgi:putative multiple sugar transport system ATP-binding protein
LHCHCLSAILVTDPSEFNEGAVVADSDVILEMRSISKEFPGVKALEDVTMTVRRPTIHAICGENGAGKSTLMKVLTGVWPHGTYSGRIVYNGEEMRFKTLKSSEKVGIAIIHQELSLIPELSVTENIFIGNEKTTHLLIDWMAARQRAEKIMARVHLNVDPDTPVKNLGVGQQQLIEIARALSKDIQLLILDEPTSALNEEESNNLLQILRELKAEGITSIMISHKLEELTRTADAITIIRDGHTVETIQAGEDGDGYDINRIIRGMVGRSLDNRYPGHQTRQGDVAFEVRGWTVRNPIRSDLLSANNVSFDVRGGEVVGFAGLMGAGRTELFRSVVGRSWGGGNVLSGSVLVKGVEVDTSTVPRAIAAGIAYVPEDRKMLGLNLLDTVSRTTVSAALSRISEHLLINTDKEVIAAEKARDELHIKTPSIMEGIDKLSGGNQQKTLLGKWLFTEPEVLILDEPTRGIDVGAKYEIYSLIFEQAALGKAVVVISSELPELLGICDRIYAFHEGEITGVVDAKKTNQEELMRLMAGIGSATAA